MYGMQLTALAVQPTPRALVAMLSQTLIPFSRQLLVLKHFLLYKNNS
jgi:hypothetical protein